MPYIKQSFKSGQVLKAEHLNSMDDQIASNEANINSLTEKLNNKPSIQFDYAQNDETAPDYIKNRPGGYDLKQRSTITDQTATSGSLMSDTTAIFNYFQNNIGNTVTVTFDGIEYECTIEGDYSPYIGDSTYTTFPFHISTTINIEASPMECAYLNTAISGESHTVKIEGFETSPVVIDRKYIPDLQTLTNSQSYMAGQFLRVNNDGVPEWQTIANANGVSF